MLVNMGGTWFAYNYLLEGQDLQAKDFAVAFGILISIFTNFLLNDTWTWGDRKKGALLSWFHRLTKYYLVAGLGGAIQWGVFRLLLPVFGGTNYLWANLFGIGAATVSNYVLMHIWSFRSKE